MFSEEILRKNKRKNDNLKKEKDERPFNPNEDLDGEEVTYMYDVRRPMEFINENTTGVFDITKQSGINTAKSTFDKTALFKTK